MSRFEEPAQEKVLSHCEECEKELFRGNEVLQTNDGLFCSTDCLIDYVGVTGVTL
ncbi:hypothetical protein [Priestia aryabhattai]|uniref:hypothetical protein n=1 Tax=Priestia aryabhattai TaxID=412384 RepID=UPI002E20A2F9|nr:hypothetical protein [Priestia aryabhattai]